MLGFPYDRRYETYLDQLADECADKCRTVVKGMKGAAGENDAYIDGCAPQSSFAKGSSNLRK